MTLASVEAAVFRAVDTLNQTLAESQQLAKSRESILVDTECSIDSMALVNLLVFIEDELGGNSNQELDLTGTNTLGQEELRTLGSVIDALHRKLTEQWH